MYAFIERQMMIQDEGVVLPMQHGKNTSFRHGQLEGGRTEKCLRIYATQDEKLHFDEVEIPTEKVSVHSEATPFHVTSSYPASRGRGEFGPSLSATEICLGPTSTKAAMSLAGWRSMGFICNRLQSSPCVRVRDAWDYSSYGSSLAPETV